MFYNLILLLNDEAIAIFLQFNIILNNEAIYHAWEHHSDFWHGWRVCIFQNFQITSKNKIILVLN